MFIFSRTATVAPGQYVAGTTFAVEIAAHVSSVIGRKVNVYVVDFGMPLGTLIWSARYESHADLMACNAKLAADTAYVGSFGKAAELFAGEATDLFTEVLATTPTPPANFISLTRATIANGKFAEAIEVGVQIQDLIAKTTNQTSAFCLDTYGTYGGVGWIAGAETAADIDDGLKKTMADPAFHELVNKAGTCYLAGSGQRALATKIN